MSELDWAVGHPASVGLCELVNVLKTHTSGVRSIVSGEEEMKLFFSIYKDASHCCNYKNGNREVATGNCPDVLDYSHRHYTSDYNFVLQMIPLFLKRGQKTCFFQSICYSTIWKLKSIIEDGVITLLPHFYWDTVPLQEIQNLKSTCILPENAQTLSI